jgi:hypothetical protein
MCVASPFVESVVTRSLHTETRSEYESVVYIHEDYVIIWYTCGCVVVDWDGDGWLRNYDLYECSYHQGKLVPPLR